MLTGFLKDKFVGEILLEAGLISRGQVEVALREQTIYPNLRLGDIIVLHGWIEQKTADFFGETIKHINSETEKKFLGEYLYQAGLITKEDIFSILNEQRQIGVKFGSMAVIRGCIKQETLDFFLRYFTSDNHQKNHLLYVCKKTTNTRQHNSTLTKSTYSQKENSQVKSTNSDFITNNEIKTVHNYEELLDEGFEEIPWKD